MDNRIIFSFPDQHMVKMFMDWMKNGDGEQVLERWAEDYMGYHIDIIRETGVITIRYAGRIVDDDDPEMNGEYEDSDE